jgi:hypothetical protein
MLQRHRAVAARVVVRVVVHQGVRQATVWQEVLDPVLLVVLVGSHRVAVAMVVRVVRLALLVRVGQYPEVALVVEAMAQMPVMVPQAA